jgi:23S rRNA pseudouridine2605 synthase
VTDSREYTVIDLLPARFRGIGIFPAGRLDKDSDGLLILTNDGMFAQRIVHPSAGIVKTYVATLAEPLGEEGATEWARGVNIEGRRAVPLELAPLDGERRRWRVVLGEGFKREIRRMAEAVGPGSSS